ncbi:MAG: hypothetical protein GF313_17250 [Caldithrix sp.]|nr:hypothetical protein [Caldithrix sp.]
MKKMSLLTVIGILSLTLGIMSCSEKPADQSEESQTTQITEAQLTIHGMECGSCENLIQTEVGNLEGVEYIKASAPDSSAVVRFDAAMVDTSAISRAIEAKGYKVIKYQY